MDLIIVESPAKARTISRLLGKGYKVEACVGHVRDLPKSRLGIDIKDNFKPQYSSIREKGPVIKDLKQKTQKAARVLLAADPDREGEAICWHLVEALGLKKNYFRIILTEITSRAVAEAIKNPGHIDINRVNAQQARRILDRIVGYKVSPILWSKAGKGLSAGRVQSVVLRLICEREAEIEAFIPGEYWTLSAELLTEGNEILTAKLEKASGKKLEIDNESEAVETEKKLRALSFKVKSLQKKLNKRNPPPPFTTSTLQQDAASKLGFGTSRTMAVAQQLYEGVDTGSEDPAGLITYMRTDSVRISAEARAKCLKFIKTRFGEKYAPEKPRTYKSKKGAQEAHEAIRPTDVNKTPESLEKALSKDQLKVYTLIWRRFIASQTQSAEINSVAAKISAGKYELVAKGQKIKFPGFLDIYPDSSEKFVPLPAMSEGEDLKLKDIQTKQNFTTPPPRYSEGSLVKALEEKGIGRPSTYAPIIRTVQIRTYVEKLQGRMKPTILGVEVNKLLVGNFAEIFNVDFTALMEKELDEIAQGRQNWTDVMDEFYGPFEKSLEKAKTDMENVKEKLQKDTGEICEKCGGKMVIKRGRFGEFIACANFPECKNSKPMVRDTGVSCPQEGCDGVLVEKRSRKGKIFYACNKYPACEFSLWNKPVPRRCEKCGAAFLVEKNRKKGSVLACVKEGCDFTAESRE